MQTPEIKPSPELPRTAKGIQQQMIETLPLTSDKKPAVTNDQLSGRIQEIINDLGTLPKSDARILAIGKLNGAIRRLQTTDSVRKGGK